MADPWNTTPTPKDDDEELFPYFDFLSGEMLVAVLQYLSPAEIGRCCQVRMSIASQ